MPLTLRPDTMAAAYEMLRTVAPFRRYKLPEADEVVFRVMAHQTTSGECWVTYDGRYHIDASMKCVGHLDTLIRLIGHEMVHLLQLMNGEEPTHNEWFRAEYAKAAKNCGWDPRD